MSKKFKIKVQSLVFDKRFFPSRRSIMEWVDIHGFVVDKRLKRPVLCCGGTFRVRQKNPDWFDKKTFKLRNLGKGVKGVYGKLKR